MKAVAQVDAQHGVAVVMPAYREAQNLTHTVEDFLTTLGGTGHPHTIVIVDDGSPDSTGEVAEWLARRHPGRVEVVHHETNQGYGAAVRTGIRTALERTSHETVFLTDSDGQFRAAELPEFLDISRRERADAVIGYRRKRADSVLRRINGFLWTQLSRIALCAGARDVDCAYKLVDRTLLEDVALRGDAATISPELLAKARRRGAHIIQRPVPHYPRRYGEQTGANHVVILRSLVGLLGMALPGHGDRPLLRNPALAAVTLAAAAASVITYLYFVSADDVLAYTDAVSHLLLTRRVVDSPTPGVAQLGAVWLPLPHLGALPLIGIDSLYYSGFAGSVVSMIAYVLTARYVFKTVVELTGRRGAAVVGAAVFALCPNVLYMQSTPMAELTLICGIAGATYHLTRWSRSARHLHLGLAAALTFLATLCRYEAWVFAGAALGVVVLVAWSRSRGSGRSVTDRVRTVEAHVVYFGLIACVGIVGWVGWNAVIFGDATFFYDGEFSDASIWITKDEVAVGSWSLSGLTYWYAVVDNVGVPLTLSGAAGCVLYAVRTRLHPTALAPLTTLVYLPFFVYFLVKGQRPLHVKELVGTSYNVRFGLIMVLPIALFVGYGTAELVRLARRHGHAVVAAATALVAVAAFGTASGGIATLDEARSFRASPGAAANFRAAEWFRQNYDGGRVLMDAFFNEIVTFHSHLPSSEVVYDGSYRQWGPALESPGANGIRWIYMRRAESPTPDRVWLALRDSPELNGYELVYSASDRLVYRALPSR